MKKIFEKLNSVGYAFLVYSALCALCLIYAPLDIYFCNIKEFSFDAFDILSVLFPVFLFAIFIGFLLLRLFRKYSIVLYRLAEAAMCIALVCLFIQGTFLADNLPSLDGEIISWSEYDYQRIYSIILWCGTTLLALILVLIFKKEIFDTLSKYLGALGLVFLLLSLVLSGISSGGFSRKRSVSASDIHLTEMSEDSNFIVLLLDAVDARAFSDVAANHPEYSDIFEDFTYYDNTMSCYAFTEHSIPMILTGEWYEQKNEYSDYLNQAFASPPFLTSLLESGYDINIYDSDFVNVSGITSRFQNYVPAGSLKYPLKFLIMQIEFVGLKYFPYDLKKHCILEPYVINIDSSRKISSGNYYYSELRDVYEHFSAADYSSSPRKQFKFIYTDGAHVPFNYNQDLEYKSDATYEDSIEASVTLVKTYLEKLKANGFYDNSVIVIMADHGYWYEMPNFRQNPILLIKGIGESHSFIVSHTPVSHADLQKTFASLELGCSAENSVIENNRRRYLFRQYDFPFEEYFQIGNAGNFDTLIQATKG